MFLAGEGYRRGQWPVGRVTEVYPGIDGLVRSVQVRCATGFKVRPVNKLALLEGVQ